MQRRPALSVPSIDISPILQELLCHLLEVVNAALQTSSLSPTPDPQRASQPHPTPAGAHLVQGSQAIFIGQVGTNPTTKELTDCKKRKAGRVLKS